MREKPEILVLCSGGLDSVTAAHLMRKQRSASRMTLLFFEYGQRSAQEERRCAKACAVKLKAEFIEMWIPGLRKISSMSGRKKRLYSQSLSDTSKESKQWYVPFRNTIFLSYALAVAESLLLRRRKEKGVIVTGFKCEGKEPYPDTTPEYVRKMNALAATAAPSLQIRVEAPLIRMDKEDIIALGKRLGVDYAQTISCYAPLRGRHCGRCLACRLRKVGFYWAGVEDATLYVKR